MFLFLIQGGVLLGICLILIGWFAFNSSRSQDQVLILQQGLSDLTVKEAYRKRFRVLEEDENLEKEENKNILRTYLPYAKQRNNWSRIS